MKHVLFSSFKMLVAGLALAFIAFSCSTDVDITDTSQGDIPVVYGLLDPNQDTHYVKVTRTFLGETDNYELAKNPDSSKLENIQVLVHRQLYGATEFTYTLFETQREKESGGDFFSGNQTVYAFVEPNLPIKFSDDFYTYKLEVVQNDEVVASSNTFLVNETELNSVFQDNRFSRDFSFALRSGNEIRLNGIEPPENCKSGQLTLSFYYENTFDDGRSEIETMDFSMGTYVLSGRSTSEEMSFSFSPSTFFDRIAQEVEDLDQVDGLVYRKIKFIVFTFTGVTEDLYYYTEINDPANSSFQERPDYSNIDNGIGIFSSRAISRSDEVRDEIQLDKTTRDALIDGVYDRINADTGEEETVTTGTGSKGFCFDCI